MTDLNLVTAYLASGASTCAASEKSQLAEMVRNRCHFQRTVHVRAVYLRFSDSKVRECAARINRSSIHLRADGYQVGT